jgi:hypothetical protein
VSVASVETCRAKGYTLQVPSILQGESLKRLQQGATVGAVATMVVGFNWVAGLKVTTKVQIRAAAIIASYFPF